MKTIHELTFSRICPVNDSIDSYSVKIETDKFLVKVEDILAAIEALPQKEFQEELTRQLAESLDGCRIETVGYHSGVKTTCLV